MPDNGYYYAMDKSYRDYKSADKICQALKSLGVQAYPVSTAQKKYLIYIGGGTAEEAKEEYNKAKGKYGYSYYGWATRVFIRGAAATGKHLSGHSEKCRCVIC